MSQRESEEDWRYLLMGALARANKPPGVRGSGPGSVALVKAEGSRSMWCFGAEGVLLGTRV